MTRKEAIKIIDCYDIGFYDLSGEKIPADKLANAFDLAIEALQDRPSGEWKCMADCGVTECDQCGWSIEEYVGDYNFCPNCGARMKGGAE